MPGHPLSVGSGHVLEGSLANEDVRTLFRRCEELEFTGLLELSEGARRQSIEFIGGQAQRGADAEALGPSWKRGRFRLLQRALAVGGRLANGVRLEGALAETPAAELLAHCERARMTADLEFVGGAGQRARARFERGELALAEHGGERSPSEEALLEALRSWPRGRYRLTVRPLFAQAGAGAAAGDDELPDEDTRKESIGAESYELHTGDLDLLDEDAIEEADDADEEEPIFPPDALGGDRTSPMPRVPEFLAALPPNDPPATTSAPSSVSLPGVSRGGRERKASAIEPASSAARTLSDSAPPEAASDDGSGATTTRNANPLVVAETVLGSPAPPRSAAKPPAIPARGEDDVRRPRLSTMRAPVVPPPPSAGDVSDEDPTRVPIRAHQTLRPREPTPAQLVQVPPVAEELPAPPAPPPLPLPPLVDGAGSFDAPEHLVHTPLPEPAPPDPPSSAEFVKPLPARRQASKMRALMIGLGSGAFLISATATALLLSRPRAPRAAQLERAPAPATPSLEAAPPPSAATAPPAPINGVQPAPAAPAAAPATDEQATGPANEDRAAERERLLAAGRKATIEGRREDALTAFKAVYAMDRKDPALRVYVPMALGRTGKGTLVLDGRGPIVVDGHTFRAPSKVTVAAGPHRVERAGRSDEITVPKGRVAHVSADGGRGSAHHAGVHAARGKHASHAVSKKWKHRPKKRSR